AALYSSMDDEQKALEIYNQVLEIERARKNRRSEGSTLRQIGTSHYNLGNYALALDYMTQSLVIARAVESRTDEAEALQRIGAVRAAMGRLEESAEAYSKSLEIHRQTGAREREAMALHGSARTEMKRGNLQTARKQIESAIELAESLRGKFTSPQLRVSLLAERKKHYETYVDVLMKLHESEPGGDHDAAALRIHELARARGLLDLLNEARADIRRGGDPDLLARERALQRQLNEKELYRMSLLRARGREKQLAEVEQELNALLVQHQETQAELRAKSPQYAALTQPKPLDLREIQTKVLDPDTVLLEYALGDERSYLWFVTHDSRATFVLPGRDEIERHARRFYDLLSADPQTASARAPRQPPARPSPAQTDYRGAAVALGKMLLGPAADRLSGKRLLVVSDGALQYVPFEALHKPPGVDRKSNDRQATVPTNDDYRPLVVEHEVV
ncbi:MAG: CHAT domain-containing protein, partial [Pyrinomonadaceae bacterium]